MRNLMTILISLTVMLFNLGVLSEGALALDRCEVPHGATYNIDEHSTCRAVTNNHASGQTIMVPTKSTAEWNTGTNAFLNALPAGVTASACSACGTITDCAAASGGGGYPTGCNTIGQTCDDGSIYAGAHPTMAGVRLYIPSTFYEGSSEPDDEAPVVIGATSLTDGLTNTDTWVSAASSAWTDTNAFYDLIQIRECYTLTAHGKNDWYLPAIKELDVLYSNLVVAPPGTGDPDNPTSTGSVAAGQGATDATRDGPYAANFSTASSYPYGSSTERAASTIWALKALDGEIVSSGKGSRSYMACVRRSTSSTCAPELGDVTPTLTCPANITGAARSTQYTTSFTVTDFTGPLDMWVATRADESTPAENGGVRMNSGAWITSGKTPIPVNPGDTITLRITTRSISSAVRGFVVRIGTANCTWNVVTG